MKEREEKKEKIALKNRKTSKSENERHTTNRGKQKDKKEG